MIGGALKGAVSSKFGALASKVKGSFTGGELAKAIIVPVSPSSGTKGKPFTVQFNPSELKISYGATTSSKKTVDGQADEKKGDQQPVTVQLATLSVTLFYDSLSPLKADAGLSGTLIKTGKAAAGQIMGMLSKPPNPTEEDPGEEQDSVVTAVNESFTSMLDLIEIDHEEHRPQNALFAWGEGIKFYGTIVGSEVQYAAFASNGMPVRATISLSIQGTELRNRKKKPLESPDRTKTRTLMQQDQLWMLADDEYGDPSRWKDIAQANDILNPRIKTGTTDVKVPSIK